MSDWLTLKSSNLDAVRLVDSTLHVRFRTGKVVWSYPGVTQQMYDDLVGAPSPGSHFAKHIRPLSGAAPLAVPDAQPHGELPPAESAPPITAAGLFDKIQAAKAKAREILSNG